MNKKIFLNYWDLFIENDMKKSYLHKEYIEKYGDYFDSHGDALIFRTNFELLQFDYFGEIKISTDDLLELGYKETDFIIKDSRATLKKRFKIN